MSKEGGDRLSQKFRSQKEKQSGTGKHSNWLISKVSSYLSRKTTNPSGNASSDNIHAALMVSEPSASAPLNLDTPKPREVIEAEVMIKYFTHYDYEKLDNEPVILPPIWVSKSSAKKKPKEELAESNISEQQNQANKLAATRQKSYHEALQKEITRPKTATRQKTVEKPSPLRAAVEMNDADAPKSASANNPDPFTFTVPRSRTKNGIQLKLEAEIKEDSLVPPTAEIPKIDVNVTEKFEKLMT